MRIARVIGEAGCGDSVAAVCMVVRSGSWRLLIGRPRGAELTSRGPDIRDRAVLDAGAQRGAEIERRVGVLRRFDRFAQRQSGLQCCKPRVLAGADALDRDAVRLAPNEEPIRSGVE